MRHAYSGLILGTILLGIAGCGDKHQGAAAPVSSTAATNADTPAPPPPVEKPPGIGDAQTIEQDDSQGHAGEREKVRIISIKALARKRCDSDGINCVVAKRRNRMIGVRLSVVGLDAAVDECASNSASLLTAAGAQSEDVYDSYLTPQLDCFKRRRGQKITGWVTMEIARAAKHLIFSWRPSNGNNADDLQWTVGSPR